ncbi:hypothetical protein FA95DRAFT_1606295 [Auriscalpium vulgare]|uniref:Uncharacterized protein n=1 Tax=Auriscalpium vulgare TaxID=40419 RepID=A0ACB8RTM2_9AGAM|nr:hypothetical protein FA95DRAFT_1606295 [Auriscalpium vulgare]
MRASTTFAFILLACSEAIAAPVDGQGGSPIGFGAVRAARQLALAMEGGPPIGFGSAQSGRVRPGQPGNSGLPTPVSNPGPVFHFGPGIVIPPRSVSDALPRELDARSPIVNVGPRPALPFKIAPGLVIPGADNGFVFPEPSEEAGPAPTAGSPRSNVA